MKLIASILITVSLSFGALTAATAYVVSLDAPDAKLVGKTLKFDIGEYETPDGTRPVFSAGTKLTTERLAALRAAGRPLKITVVQQLIAAEGTFSTGAIEALEAAPLTRLDVKEFEFGLWRGRWIFMLSLAGLLVGALMLRQDAARRVKRVEESHARASPTEAIDAAIGDVRKVRDRIVHLQGRQRCHAIIEGLDEAERTHLPAFVDSRERLIARHGLAGFAKIMDRFAAAERQVHRAWSLAADGVELDAIDCLERADTMLDETRAMLR